MSIHGSYADGQRSQSCAAMLSADQSAIGVLILSRENETPRYVHIGELEISSRLGSTPREFNFADGARFVTDDNEGADQLLNALGPRAFTSVAHYLEKNLYVVVAGLLVTVAVSWALVIYGIPTTAKFLAHKIPQEWLAENDTTLAVLDKTMLSDSELGEDVKQRFQNRAQQILASFPAVKPQIQFRQFGSPNAFALPNGQIIFTDEFIEMIESDEEFVAVLFHEVGHIEHRHLIRRTLQDSILAIGILLVVGDLNSADLLAGVPTLFLDLAYSRDFESESDWFALEQMHAHGIELEYFASVMDKLSRYDEPNSTDDEVDVEIEVVSEASTKESVMESLPKYLSTHPAAEDRIALIATFRAQKETPVN